MSADMAASEPLRGTMRVEEPGCHLPDQDQEKTAVMTPGNPVLRVCNQNTSKDISSTERRISRNGHSRGP